MAGVDRRGVFWLVTSIFLLGVILVPGSLALPAQARWEAKVYGAVRYVETELPLVALTFDDGPDPHATEAVLAVLRNHHVPATFFLIGEQVEMYPDLVRSIQANGHEIGNHSYSHRLLTNLNGNKAVIIDEVQKGAAAIARVTGRVPVLFRPPRRYDENMVAVVRAQGSEVILWSLDTSDWRSCTPAIRDAIRKNVSPGDIILMHDRCWGSPAMQQVLGGIIDDLRSRNFQLVTVSTLLSAGGK